MTNKERQKQLDQQKWIESEQKKKDQSGRMDYCSFCYYRVNDFQNDDIYCLAGQEYKEEDSICAKEYNRMIRARKNV